MKWFSLREQSRTWTKSNDIWAFRFSARNAERYVDRIVRFCKSIALAPYRGTSLNELHPALRSVGMERRVSIQFRITGTQVVILGVYYAGRTIERKR